MKIRRTLAIAAICALLPALALAQAADATDTTRQGGFQMRAGSQMGRYNVDRTQLSDQQKQAYDKALSDYAAVEDEALANLVAAGDVTQDESDRFTRTRDQQGAMASMEMDSWSTEQQQAFQSAMTASGDERAAAFAALVSSGLLTQAQADAFASMGGAFMGRRAGTAQDGQPPSDGNSPTDAPFPQDGQFPADGQFARDGAQGRGGSFDIWTEIQSREQTASIQSALATIQTAQQAFSEALSGAGIEMAN